MTESLTLAQQLEQPTVDQQDVLGVVALALKLKRSVAEYARRTVFVTGSGMWSDAYYQRCLEIVGPERLLFSTDFPDQYRPGGYARRFLEETSLDQGHREAFAHGNWDRLTGGTLRR